MKRIPILQTNRSHNSAKSKFEKNYNKENNAVHKFHIL